MGLILCILLLSYFPASTASYMCITLAFFVLICQRFLQLTSITTLLLRGWT